MLVPHPPSRGLNPCQSPKFASDLPQQAAFALANICAGGGGGSGDSEALNWLFAADRYTSHEE